MVHKISKENDIGTGSVVKQYVDREDWKKLKGKRCVWKAITKGKRDN